MMGMLWVVFLVALTGSRFGYSSPVRSTPEAYPHETNSPVFEGWGSEGGLYAAIPALALVITAVGLLFGCTWCYRHKDCKPNAGADNQLFTASATHLHDGRRAHPPDSGFSEPANNNISEDNNNGPISLREMQNIANNNAAAYIVSENEERNRVSRESVVEFEPLPTGIRVVDPLEHCADWFGGEDFPRSQLQYLREIGRGWFGRVVEGELGDAGASTTVAVKILNQNASLEDKARFLDEAKVYRDLRHENVLAFVTKCLQEDPWILIFELCSTDLQQYLIMNRPKMAALNESGVPLRLLCDVSAALAHIHSRGYLYGSLWCGAVLVRGAGGAARGVLGRYAARDPPYDFAAPETRAHPPIYTASSDVWALGTLVWEVCAWGGAPGRQPPPPDLPCPYSGHLYQVMQLCWQASPAGRPTAAQVQALVAHLHASQRDRGGQPGPSDFEDRWQRLKPNTIPKIDEHVAIIHAPSTSMASHFTGSDQDLDTAHTIQDSLSIDMDTAVSRSSSIMSDKDPLSVQIKSESLNNLHGSLEDVRNIYLTHNETAALECHQGNISLEDAKEKEQDRSDGSVDPWLKDIIAGSQDDVSYYKDVSDVIKNLDNILNSEKTSSSESSHQASPSRDNLSLDCKKDYPVQSSMVKSPGITNFQHILDTGFNEKTEDGELCEEDDVDRDTIGTLSHSFERHSEVDSTSQHTLENITPETPIKDLEFVGKVENQSDNDIVVDNEKVKSVHEDTELPKEIVNSDNRIPKLMELCVASIPSDSDIEQLNNRKDCQTSCDSKLNDLRTDIKDETKSIDDIGKLVGDTPHKELENKKLSTVDHMENSVELILPEAVVENTTDKEMENSPNSEQSELNPEVVLVNDLFIPTTAELSYVPTVTSDLVEISESPKKSPHDINILEITHAFIQEEKVKAVDSNKPHTQTPEIVQNTINLERISETNNLNETEKTELPTPIIDEMPTPVLPPEIVQNIVKKGETVKTNTILEDTAQEDIENEIRKKNEEVSEAIESASSFEEPSIIVRSNIDTQIEIMPEETTHNIISSEDLTTQTETKLKVSSLKKDEAIDTVIAKDKKSPEIITEEKNEMVDVSNENKEIVSKISKIPYEVANISHEFLKSDNSESPVIETIMETEIMDNTNTPLIDREITEITKFQTVPTQKELAVPSNNTVSKNYENVDSVLVQENQTKFQEDLETVHAYEQSITEDIKDTSTEIITVEKVYVDEDMSVLNNLEFSKPGYEGTTAKESIEDKELSVSTDPTTEMELLKNEHLPTAEVKTFPEETLNTRLLGTDKEQLASVTSEVHDNNIDRSDNLLIDTKERSDNSTAYMDLTNRTNNEALSDTTIDSNVRDVIKSCLEITNVETNCSLAKNESTEYLDLPSFRAKEVDDFLHMEKVFSGNNIDVVSSTPLASDSSADADVTVENSSKELETQIMSETKVPDYGPGVSLTKLEQKYVPESMSPFESPTKSHHTDTYDENSSVVLGPFENCTLELFKGVKSTELVDIPKEELLAFSSNFSEINLETPSPLRDSNFLNEVPDIVHDDLHFDDIQSVSDKPSQSDTDSGKSATEKHISPSTPPNSPGIFLASTSQQKYLVDIDFTPEIPDPDLSLQKEIELNQIELQITSKMAIAENENNLNLEYSGPLTVQGLVSEDEGVLLREGDTLPESFLAGNGGSVEDLREGLTLDEECVKALRNELELKLPLAQVAAIEPQCENEWSTELPPPPELVVSYPGALSPIAEETGQQLSAYENDANWNMSTRTDSSESYPEPCNNSTDEVTDLPTGANSGPRDHSTFTVHSRDQSQNNTYTVQRDIMSSREITMSADSLNASPYRKPIPDTESPIDDKTYTKQDEDKETSCERISQVSPFLLSPVTDTSAPDQSDNLDNATGVSTLSKTTLPTDAKLSKPSETQCLSKATSIDSWCSNDTLYNVEENFDDLAMDPETEFEKEEGNSESTDTLTHNEDEKEASHCSTYIIHDSKSDPCETFSPDSITANDNYTYTKVKTDAATTPSAVTKSELNDSTKDTTKDLAYGTLMSGLPSYSNCTTEVISGIDDWKLAQPEMVRKSIGDDVNMTPPSIPPDDKENEHPSPKLTSQPAVKKMDSVDISCLQDKMGDSHNKSERESDGLLVQVESPNSNYKTMAPSVTSTPIIDLTDDDENVQAIPMKLPEVNIETSDNSVNVGTFQTFLQSAEVRPQDLSSNISNEYATENAEVLLEGDSNTLSRNSNRDSGSASERTPNYSDFENSAIAKAQSIESGISSEDFTKFENSVKSRPQDLSSLIDASSLLLKSERMSSELLMGSSGVDHSQTSESVSRVSEPQSQSISPPSVTNLKESHNLVNFREPSGAFLINFDVDDETEQPHSIIITETLMDMLKESPNKSHDCHAEAKVLDLTYSLESHAGELNPHSQDDIKKSLDYKMNGETKWYEEESLIDIGEHMSPKEDSLCDKTNVTSASAIVAPEDQNVTPNGSISLSKVPEIEEADCDGSEKFATMNFLSETFEELIESNVDDGESKDSKQDEQTSGVTDENIPESIKSESPVLEALGSPKETKSIKDELQEVGEVINCDINGKLLTVTQDFLQNEKMFCRMDSYLPLLSDIRFTGPATEIMSTSFNQESPTDPTSPECEQDSKPDTAADILKEWDSDTESHTSNSSSGEFIWKGGDGHETSVVPSTHFDHQRSGGSQGGSGHGSGGSGGTGGSGASSGSGSGSEGDEVEFVPSSWDCRAAPAKSSLRSLETTPDSKKRVVFKRQKYHCVYEYPREAAAGAAGAGAGAHSPAAWLPDLSTYCDWDPSSAEDAEIGYGQLFGAPSPLDLYPLRAGIAFGADYDEDFFISSSARPFESLGIMSTTSQFFPGKHVKPALLERDLSDDVVSEDFPPPPSPLPTTTLVQARTPSLDFTTPDSGVEDITPGSTTDEDFKKKLPESELTWRPVDSASSSESVSPSSPGGEALGGLRHTRDKLKLDLPPSPHIPSPRHNRVFNFVLDKPKRREDRPELGSTPLVMTDETPIVTTALPLPKDEDLPVQEPTFSTFGKSPPKIESEQKLILDEVEKTEGEVKVESPKVVEAVKGEGTVLDSGDEDSGIESSSKATLERNKTSNVS